MKKFILILALLPGLLIAQEEESADEMFDHGYKLQREQKFGEAIQAYTMALSIDDKHENSLLQRAWCYNYKGRYEKAAADYGTIIEMHPEQPYAYLSRGGAYNKLEKWDDAMADFNKVLMELNAGDKEKIEALNNRGFSKKGKGDQAGACADWKRAKKMGSDEAKVILKNNYCK